MYICMYWCMMYDVCIDWLIIIFLSNLVMPNFHPLVDSPRYMRTISTWHQGCHFSITFLSLWHVTQADRIFLNCCTCNARGQRNILERQHYSFSSICMSSQMPNDWLLLLWLRRRGENANPLPPQEPRPVLLS